MKTLKSMLGASVLLALVAAGCQTSPTGVTDSGASAQTALQTKAALATPAPSVAATTTVTGRVFQLSPATDRQPAIVPYARITVRRGINQTFVLQTYADRYGNYRLPGLVSDPNYSIKAENGYGKFVIWYGGLAGGARSLDLYVPWY